jgi:hypothetical protein
MGGYDDRSARDPDVHRDLIAEFGGKLMQRRMCFRGREKCAIWIVSMCDGRSEERHDLVADVSVDGTAETLDYFVYGLKDTSDDRMQVLGVEMLQQIGVPGQISEKNRNVSTLARRAAETRSRCLHRNRVGGRGLQLQSAAAAISVVGIVREAAFRTGMRQRSAARGAESPFGSVFTVADAALQRGCFPAPLLRCPGGVAQGASQQTW